MSPPISKLQRWLDLIAYLIGRRYPVDVDAIMENVPAYARALESGDRKAEDRTRRMFERDKDELRAIGIPIETVSAGGERDPVEGYRLSRRDFYLPCLKMLGSASGPAPRGVAEIEIRPEEARDAREALALIADLPGFPLRQEAFSAYRKLSFDFQATPAAMSRQPAGILFADHSETESIRDTLRILNDALQRRKRVRFRYHGIYRGTATDRDVASYGLLFQRGHWYLIGHDALRDAVRVFRVGRMEEVKTNPAAPKSPDYELPQDFDLSAFRRREAWELGAGDEPPIRALVEFRFPASLWVARNEYGKPVEARPGGAEVRAFDVHQVNPFVRWVLSLGGEAEILEPPELRQELDAVAAEVAALYRPERS